MLLDAIIVLFAALSFCVSNKTEVTGIPLCLLKCKDDHMMKMDSEWSMDFAFPLLSLLRSNGSEEAAYHRANEICYHNNMLGNCISSCEESLEKKILRLGLKPWDDICHSLRTLRTQFGCWKFHIESLSLSCYMESQRLRISMRKLAEGGAFEEVGAVCGEMTILSKCVLEEYGKACGKVTTKLLAKLFRSSHEVIREMLGIKWSRLPSPCNETLIFGPMAAKYMSASPSAATSALLIASFLLTSYIIHH
uniref:CPG4 domain-containing protein n=2 Tax=Bursaphelenchus xylophilus TaxID=6326 RepID=A0A1I7SDX6_BURXY